jgi:cell division transport system ATP-binding protein
MINFDNVSKRYPEGQEALSKLNFTIDKGEMAFITGKSGAGKSTLLKLIMLMKKLSQGQLIVNGQNLKQISSHQLPCHRRQIGVVFQDHQRYLTKQFLIMWPFRFISDGTDIQKPSTDSGPLWIR